MMQGEVGPAVLKDGAQEDKGDTARLQYFVGAIAVGDLVKATLGPKGLDKILQPMQLEAARREGPTVTNDGATILKSVWLDNPAAKILADLALQQDMVCGDGTTGVVVLAAELLREAEQLVEKNIHPQTIISGYRKAAAAARKKLAAVAFDVATEEGLRTALLNVARTTLSSKLLPSDKEHFANIAVDAILRLRENAASLDLIHILKKPGGCLKDSFLDDGFILEKKIGVGQPKVKENCKVMVANTPMDTDKIKIFGARVKVDSFEAVHQLELAEKEKMKEKVEKILAYKCDVFINRQLIYNYPDQLFKAAGVAAIEHSDFDGMERLAAALGAEILSTFDDPSEKPLGFCAKMEEIVIGDDTAIRFSGCKEGAACTVVLRGSSEQGLDEAERSLHDALAILSQLVLQEQQQRKQQRQAAVAAAATATAAGEGLAEGILTSQEQRLLLVSGGGAAEMAMEAAVSDLAKTVPGKESLAIEGFARALRQIPTIIVDNAGLDSAQIVSELRALHHAGKHNMGVCVDGEGGTVDAKEKGVLEAYKSKLSQLCFAAEAAEMIIRVDDIIRCAPRERSGM
ncbi:TCP-1/cpn60 family chaperonin, putative [Eimeria maxima]|uniref:CCT-beta n=1 Tax=Eimeria maxima TaxID=5804 RepID=U6MAP4_EIMMA|nr:TCP-1/cpn60 family chaperonin, putative [Eimeria maxima]CDJ61297.1 TCP-1/cpn60 family chaperonin, putative [Eimeria maxima]